MQIKIVSSIKPQTGNNFGWKENKVNSYNNKYAITAPSWYTVEMLF